MHVCVRIVCMCVCVCVCLSLGRRGLAVTFFTEADMAHLRPIANVVKLSGCEVRERERLVLLRGVACGRAFANLCSA